MVKDIEKYYPRNTKGFSLGLFEKPLRERQWSNKPNKSIHGVSYTQFEEAFDVKVGDICLFDYFHGYCDDFALYFKQQHPDFEIMEIRRNSGWNSLVHVFAVKEIEDGYYLFADARGITDDCFEFFSDFKFSKFLNLEKTDTNRYVKDKKHCKMAYGSIYTSQLKDTLNTYLKNQDFYNELDL